MADGSQPLIGSIALFAGNFAPRGFMLCQGQLLAISSNTALFAILGTTYGGNGQTTFALPDLRGRAPAGQGQGPGLPIVDLGEVTGTSQVTVLSTQMPMHSHPIKADTTGFADQQSPAGHFWSQQGDAINPVNGFSGGSRNANMSPVMCSMSGSSLPISVQNPFLGLNFIICVQGVFPSRN
jgi:microcystin-dependent protein